MLNTWVTNLLRGMGVILREQDAKVLALTLWLIISKILRHLTVTIVTLLLYKKHTFFEVYVRIFYGQKMGISEHCNFLYKQRFLVHIIYVSCLCYKNQVALQTGCNLNIIWLPIVTISFTSFWYLHWLTRKSLKII